MFLFTPNISVFQGQVGEKLNSNSCSLPGANSFPGLCGTSWRRARAKGSRQKYLLLWQQSGSAAVLLSSPCCQNIQTLLSAASPPSTILPSPSKEAGRQHVRRQDRSGAGPGKYTADVAEGHIFCFYCTSWLRSPALSNGLQREMLLKFKPRTCGCVPGSRRGGVWLCGLF